MAFGRPCSTAAALGPLLALLLSLAPLHGARAQQSIRGFGEATAAAQRRLEAAYTAIPSPEEAKRQHRIFTAEPHAAGSDRNNELARYIADEWKKQGFDEVVIRRYDVYSSDAKSTSLEMVAPVRYRASLREAAYDVDPDTKNPDVAPASLSWSAAGDTTAPVVYANSGNPADYEVLRRHGISVRGKIVLVRYSYPYSYRGFKAQTAEREGAAGILIYSDPAEDGYRRGKVFPDGPWGPETHLQRGAITYDFQQSGDPTTPGWPSVPGARHIPAEQSPTVPKIMALPLSWHDAKPLLQHLDGPEAPPEWQGGLPLKYRLGGERVRVHLKIEMNNRITPNYVVEGRIRGSEHPDEWVLLGNHRDAWVFGGADPSSGTATMMEVTRGLGELVRQGMRPRRTVVALSWDGEETSYAGSAEWSEQFAQELRHKAVAYLNVDVATTGPNFQASAVGSLAPLVVDASRDVADPSGAPLYEAWKVNRAKDLTGGKSQVEVTDFNLVETRIGSGSDYAPLLDIVGVPVLDLGFDGPYGVYHSVYDNFYWINHFADPGYRYHTALARLWGVLTLRLANAELLPYHFGSYGAHLQTYLDTLSAHIDTSRLDLAPLRARIAAFEAAGQRLDSLAARALAAGKLDPLLADQINRGMMDVERNFIHLPGIPGRPAYKHLVYACRPTYAHLELPGLTEAAERGDWPLAAEQARVLEQAVGRNADLIGSLTAQLGGAAGMES